MKISTSTLSFLEGGIWAKTPAEAVALFENTHFRYLDFDFNHFAAYPTSPIFEKGERWKSIIYDAANEAARLGIRFVVAHSLVDHAAYQKGGEGWERSLNCIKHSIEACGMLGIPDIVIHGYFSGATKEEEYQSNKEFFETFTDELAKHQVSGLIENGFGADRMLEAIAYSENPYMHAVWDIGHANIWPEKQYEHIVMLGEHLHTIHVHDNFGNLDPENKIGLIVDTHMLPFTGTCNYDEVMQALIDCGYKGYFNMEAIEAMRGHRAYSRNARREWTRSTKLFDPPVELRVMMEELVYQTAAAILKAYDVYEE